MTAPTPPPPTPSSPAMATLVNRVQHLERLVLALVNEHIGDALVGALPEDLLAVLVDVQAGAELAETLDSATPVSSRQARGPVPPSGSGAHLSPFDDDGERWPPG